MNENEELTNTGPSRKLDFLRLAALVNLASILEGVPDSEISAFNAVYAVNPGNISPPFVLCFQAAAGLYEKMTNESAEQI
jgi:hypothetical protein